MNKVIFSSDVDYLQSDLIVFKNNICLWLDDQHDGTFIVYKFDLLTSVESWINIDEINSSCGTNYTTKLKKSDRIDLTSNVCWYYGVTNLDGCPMTYTDCELLSIIDRIVG